MPPSLKRLEIASVAALVVVAALACRRSTSNSRASASATATASAPVEDAGPSPERQKAEVAKLVAKLGVIAKVKLPSISSKATLEAYPPKPTLDGFANAPNAAIANIEQLADLRVDKALPGYASDALSWCGAWTSGKKDDIPETKIRDCLRFRYVVVMRFRSYIKPKMTGKSSFRPGSCVGDATVFDLETGKRLGSVPVSATNSDELDAMQNAEDVRIQRDLERQCSWSAQYAIDQIYGEPTK